MFNEKELESEIVKLIIDDRQLKDFIEASRSRGIEFIDFEMNNKEFDKNNLTYDFDITKRYILNKQFNKIYKIDTIEYHINNHNHLTITDIVFLENEEEVKRLIKKSRIEVENDKELKLDSKKRINSIEDYTNNLIQEIEEDFKKQITNIKILINELLENNFKENDKEISKIFKEKIKDFVKSYQVRRVKNFTKSMIINSLKIRIGKLNIKMKKLLNFDKKSWQEIFQNYKEAKFLKEEKSQIDKFKREIVNILDEIIDYLYIELAEENYKLNVNMNEKYNSEINEDILEVDRRQLLIKVFEELTSLFTKYGLNKSDFRVV